MTYSLADPSGPAVLASATRWLEATLLGTVATTLAVICVAWIGVMMLSGRVNVRHGITTILGCFLLFGATSIAAGIRCAAQGECSVGGVPVAEADPITSPFPEVKRTISSSPVEADPYAGAAIRRRN
jgi:type IV secretory pathway VirB2 component (pilin)